MSDWEIQIEMPSITEEELKKMYVESVKSRAELMGKVEKLQAENKELKEQLAPINELLEVSSAEDTEELAKDVSWLWEQDIDPEDYQDFVSLAQERGLANADDLRSEIDEFEGDIEDLKKEIKELKDEVIAERKKVIEADENRRFVGDMWMAESRFLQDSAKNQPEEFNDFLKEEFDEEMYKKMYEGFELEELLECEA